MTVTRVELGNIDPLWVIYIALYMCKMVILAWNSGVTLDWTCNKYAVRDDMQLRVNIHLYMLQHTHYFDNKDTKKIFMQMEQKYTWYDMDMMNHN